MIPVRLPNRPIMTTDRLMLRQWKREDADDFAAMNADPRVMAHLPALLMRWESDELLGRLHDEILGQGYGLWAVTRHSDGALLGFCGIRKVGFPGALNGRHEIAWRFARKHWGAGYASEAALAALELAFGPLGLDEVVAFTVPGNTRSQALMARIAMRRAPELDFDHPALPEGHRLRRHVTWVTEAA